MENPVLCMCKFDGKTLVLGTGETDGFENLRAKIMGRWNELEGCLFNLYYNLPNNPRCCLDNEEDYRNLFYVVNIMGIKCVNIHVLLPVPQARIAYEPSSEVGECSRVGNKDGGSDMLDTFCIHERKQLMTVGWDKLLTRVGQVFEGGVKEVRLMLQKLRLESGYEYDYVRNDPEKVHVVCANRVEKCCPWDVYVSKSLVNGYFYVRRFVSSHTCTSFMNDRKGPTSKLVASLFQDNLKNNGNMSPSDVKKQLITSFGLSCSYDVAWNAVRIARDSIFGTDEMCYSNIREYARCVISTNPGSHVALDIDDESSRFSRIFVSFGASIQGFKYCLPLLFLDGAHLKHRFKGHVLAANGIDGNSGSYTLCFAIVDSENDANWSWFLENLRFCLDEERSVTFFSDRNPGLIAGILRIFPHCHHSYCLWHLKSNLKDRLGRAKYSKQLKERVVHLFTQCAYAPTVEFFNRKMSLLIAEGKYVAEEFVHNLPYNKWANAYFPGMRYGYMCSSVAESFNAWICKERELNGPTMIDRIRLKMMQHIADRGIDSSSWSSPLCPEVDSRLNEYYTKCKAWNVIRSSPTVFEVICHPSEKVDVQEHTCSCQRWQLSGAPCEHAVLCIKKFGIDVLSCVDPVFHADTYRSCYSFSICPVPSLEMCNDVDLNLILPPMSRRMPGRPKRRRIKSKGESVTKPIKCGRCGIIGNHNRKTCSEPLNRQ